MTFSEITWKCLSSNISNTGSLKLYRKKIFLSQSWQWWHKNGWHSVLERTLNYFAYNLSFVTSNMSSSKQRQCLAGILQVKSQSSYQYDTQEWKGRRKNNLSGFHVSQEIKKSMNKHHLYRIEPNDKIARQSVVEVQCNIHTSQYTLPYFLCNTHMRNIHISEAEEYSPLMLRLFILVSQEKMATVTVKKVKLLLKQYLDLHWVYQWQKLENIEHNSSHLW